MVCCKWRACQRQARSSVSYSAVMGVFCGAYQIGMRALGPLLFVGANLLILSIAFLFLFWFYPEVQAASTGHFLVHLILGLYLLTNILFNYYACVWTAPGSPSYCPDPARLLGEKISIVDGRKIYQFSYHISLSPGVSYRYCHTCKCIKPPRAHHCSVLGRCVLNMDHYCPWMSNTVGYYNYRYFVLFLVYLSLACIYVLAFFLCETVQLSQKDKSFIYLNSVLQTHVFHANSISASIYCFSVTLAGLISAGLLMFWHLYLTLTNQTTLEFYEHMAQQTVTWTTCLTMPFAWIPGLNSSGPRNPFDEGWRKNLKRVLGDVPWYRNLWPSFHTPPPPKYPFELEERVLREYINV